MKTFITDRGKNITNLQTNLLRKMDGEDATRVVLRAKELVENLPPLKSNGQKKQGLMLGLVQSGKTGALATAIALAADNGYRCFVVLTSDILWLYEQTIDRLKKDLQGLEIEGKDQWEGLLFSSTNITPEGNGLILVSNKNSSMLENLINTLNDLKPFLGGTLPVGLVIDDEADQASLDTKASRRAKKPTVEPGTISKLVNQLRECFDSHTYLQVTATPQALFLQDLGTPFRPEFTILIEPGKGYIGGNTFFSLEWGKAEELIRYVPNEELVALLDKNYFEIPSSLKSAICIFYVGATIKYLIDRSNPDLLPSDLVYCFLCHISQKKSDHSKAFGVIRNYIQQLSNGLNASASLELRTPVEQDLRSAYNDLSETIKGVPPSFEDVWSELQGFITGTDIQVLNSDNDALNQPRYSRRYNILIGGNKLARGVTIDNLLVTYYGRQTKKANMDTMLQHARMYGYRAKYLDITRLFVTPEIEERFRLINESEQALRDVVEQYPNEEYRGILIGKNVGATRRNVLNANNIGAYAAGKSYFPRMPLFRRSEVEIYTEVLNQILNDLYPKEEREPVEITLAKMLEIVGATKSDSSGSGLWNDNLIVTSLTMLKNEQRYANKGFLVVRRERELRNQGKKNEYFGAVLGPDDSKLAKQNSKYPTLYMYRLKGLAEQGWDNFPFWVPVVTFPDGRYAMMFNLEQS